MTLALAIVFTLVIFLLAFIYRRFELYMVCVLVSVSSGIFELYNETLGSLAWVLGWGLLCMGWVSITMAISDSDEGAEQEYQARLDLWKKHMWEEDHEVESMVNDVHRGAIKRRIANNRRP